MTPDDFPGDLADALDRSEGFQILARSLPDAVLVLRPDGVVAHASDRAAGVVGLDREAVIGHPFLDLVTESDRGAFPAPPQTNVVGSWDFRAASDGRWLTAAFLTPRTGGEGSDLAAALGDATLVLVRSLPTGTGGARDRTDLLRRALDAANNIIVVSDPQAEDNPLVFANEHFFEVTGYTREDVIGRNCRFLQVRGDGSRDDDQDGVREIRRAIKAGEPANVVLRNYRKSGELFYNELYITPIRDREGRVVNYVGVQNDVTARIQAERDAASRAGLLQAFFDSATALMGVVQRDDAGLLHRTANAAAAGVFNRDPDDVAGLRLDELGFTSDEVARWNAAATACRERAHPVTFETVYPWDADPDGEGVRNLRVTMTRVRGPRAAGEGDLYSYTGVDYTAQRRADRERRLLAAAVESAAESILVTDAELDPPGPRIVYVNPAHTEIFGYSQEEVLGRTPRMFQGPETDRGVLDRIRRKLEAGEPVRAETTNYRKDGTPIRLEWEIAPVRDENGEVVSWVGTQRDVTERRRLEHEVVEATGREQERMARELHDGLGQVLTGSSIKLELLRRELEARGEAALAADAGRVAELVSEALEQARSIAHGLFPVSVEPDGLDDALAGLAARAETSFGIACSFASDGRAAVGSSEDAGHLYRIVQEAMTNAVRHGRADAVAIRLGPGDDGYAELVVEDDGVGISDDALEGAPGIGLRTMAYRARRVGGALDVRRRGGGGTAVRVRFTPPRPEDGPDERSGAGR